MDKTKILNSLTILAQAYAFAKDGNEDMAGSLFVEAAVDGNLDQVMDGLARGAELLANEDKDDTSSDDNTSEDNGSDEGDGDNGDEKDLPEFEGEPTAVTANVELPESVARLAARTLV